MTDKLRELTLLALESHGCERLKDFYECGPVQRAAVETFLEAALAQQDAQQKHKPLFAEMIAQHPGLAEELAQQDAQAVAQGYKLVPVAADIEVRRHLEGKSGADFLLAYADWCRPAAAPTPPAVKESLTAQADDDSELAQQDAQAVPIAMKTHGAWDGLELLDGLPDGTCLYAAPTPPAQRVMLTDEEISRIYTEQTGAAIEDSPWALNDFVRAAIEAYDRKNGTK